MFYIFHIVVEYIVAEQWFTQMLVRIGADIQNVAFISKFD